MYEPVCVAMKFSVLMSVYAKENPGYLAGALDSILHQTHIPDEIVIVEDGPLSDALTKVLDLYQKKTPIVNRVKLEKNYGLGVALNKGLGMCTNDIVARMDADDISRPDRFERQLKALEENTLLGLVGANIAEYDDSMSTMLSVRTTPELHTDIMAMMPKRSPFNHNVVLYRKSVVQRAGGYRDCPSFEDYDLWCRMAKDGAQFYNIQENLLDMRTSDAIARRRGGLSYFRNMASFQKKILTLGIISKGQFVQNMIVRGSVALMPAFLRVVFYRKLLRGKTA